MRQPKVRVDLQRLTEGLGRGIVVVLLEVRDAEVVGAIGALQPLTRGVRWLCEGAHDEQNRGGDTERAQDHGVVARMGVVLSRPLAS